MKTLRYFALLATLTLTTSAAGQITLTLETERELDGSRRTGGTEFADSVTVGQAHWQMLQDLAAQAGAGQLWDITGFTLEAPLPIDNFFRKFDPNDTSDPGHNDSDYQTADCYVVDADSMQFYSYFHVNESGVSQLGSLAPAFNSKSVNSPPDLQLDFPVSFGNSWQSVFQETQSGFSSAVLDRSVSYDVDGWGTLRTPLGDFDALRIMRVENISVGGSALPEERDIMFVTAGGDIEVNLGYDSIFMWYESLGFTSTTTTGGGPDYCTGGTANSGVLLVVDDAGNLNASDTAIRDLLIALSLQVTILSDNDVQTSDGVGRDLIVISATVDPSAIAADWSTTAVPVVVNEAGFFDNLLMTGGTAGTDLGSTGAMTSVSIVDGAHPIANGYTGSADVYTVPSPMNWGAPSASGTSVAEDDQNRSVIFTYESAAAMVGGDAPARRAAFYADDNGLANATPDGSLLFRHTVLWALGRESEITSTVAFETVKPGVESVRLARNFPNPFRGTTTIAFELVEPAAVKLVVFDLLGREVLRLADDNFGAGRHEVSMSASSLPGGAYIYRLTTGDTSLSQRMVVLH